MKRYLAAVLGGLALAGGWIGGASAQTPRSRAHVAKARAAAYEPGHDFTVVFDTLCAPALSERGPTVPGPQVAPSLAARSVPPRAAWYTAPSRVFDNLYYLGSIEDSSWAVATSEGIILVDTGYDYSIKELSSGLRTFGLDPADIKYVVLSHAHGDRYFGARYLQDTYRSRVIMSEADWDVMARSNEPSELKARKDMVATDGMKLVLGDTTLTLHITPGHTPGTISTLVPLRDGGRRHLGAIWGGMNPGYERYGVRYYPTLPDALKTWSASIKRFQEIAANEGADVYLSIHPYYDKALDKAHALNFRGPGDPHTFVSASGVQRFLTVMGACTDAQLARITSD